MNRIRRKKNRNREREREREEKREKRRERGTFFLLTRFLPVKDEAVHYVRSHSSSHAILLLEERKRDATLLQLECARQPCDTRADDHDFRIHRVHRGRRGRRGRRAASRRRTGASSSSSSPSAAAAKGSGSLNETPNCFPARSRISRASKPRRCGRRRTGTGGSHSRYHRHRSSA